MAEARQLKKTAFIKPPNDKSFPARVYIAADLSTDYPDEMLVLVAEIVQWEKEFRYFILNRSLKTFFILPSDTQDLKTRNLEQRFHDWVLRQFQAGLSRFQFNNELHSAVSLIPGKMLWSDFGELIYREFSTISNKPFSVHLLNSFAICA